MTQLVDILRRVKDLSTQSNERHWKINGITDELKCLQNDFVSLSQRVAYLKSANSEITNDVDACEKHKADTMESLGELHGCLEELQVTLDTIERFVHPCGGSGWRQIVDFDISNPATMCPDPGEWTEIVSPTGVRSCGRSTNTPGSCDSVIYAVTFPNGEPYVYNQVCGRVTGYQLGRTTAFAPFQDLDTELEIDDAYVDGLVFTRNDVSGTRDHIWTFAAGFLKQGSSNVVPDEEFCPCIRDDDDFSGDFSGGSNVGLVPPFVNGEYFCESALESIGINGDPDTDIPNLGADIETFDPLWNGPGCATGSECCDNGAPPFFQKTFATSTSDNIEARLCFSSAGINIGIERIELFVR